MTGLGGPQPLRLSSSHRAEVSSTGIAPRQPIAPRRGAVSRRVNSGSDVGVGGSFHPLGVMPPQPARGWVVDVKQQGTVL
jgi:hypothetical protein